MNPSHSPRVLVVEDQRVVARDIRSRLVVLGYEPVGDTGSGEEALGLVEQHRPDLVLMDIHLQGGVDGIEAARRIRERWGTPVVFLTAYAEETTLRRASTAEPFGFIVKPFEDRELRTAIEIALYKYQAEQNLRASQEEHRAVLRTTLDGYWVTDAQGRFLEVNDAYCRLVGYTREELLAMSISDLEADESPAEVAAQIQRNLQAGTARFERRHRRKDGQMVNLEVGVTYLPFKGRFHSFLRDITERKQLEGEREITMRLLGLVNAFTSLKDLLQEVVRLFREWSGCEVVGIRLHDGDDYPYLETHGLRPEQICPKGLLCARDPSGKILRDEQGQVRLVCLCGSVLRGCAGGSASAVTSQGSFWTNSTRQEFSGQAESSWPPPECGSGCGGALESLALIPLRAGSGVLGLLQLADHRAGRFTPGMMRVLERLADSLAVAIAHLQAQEKLRVQALVLDQIRDMITVTDLQGRITYVNAEQARKLGRAPEELIGKTTQDYVTEASQVARQREVFEQTLVQGTWQGELVNVDASGRPFVIACRTFTVRNELGKAVALCGVATDITARKATEQALRQSEERLLLAVEAAQMGTWERDLKSNRLFWSAAEEWLMGYEAGTFPGTDAAFLELIHPDSVAAHAVAQQRARTQDGVFHAELHFRLRDGRERWGLVRGQLLLDDQGQPDRMVGVEIDITERKHAEQALRASEERFRAVVECGPDGVFIQTEGAFAYLNSSAIKLFGATAASQLLGQLVLERIAPEDRARVRERMRWLNEQLQPVPRAEERCLRLDGSVFEAEINAVPFAYEGKQGALVFLRDITDRKHLEIQLRQAQKMEAVGQLAGGVAHDFNNILAATMLHLELLQQNANLAPDVQESLKELMTHTKRAASLTRQLLLFGRRSVMQVRALDVNEVVENLLKMLRRLIGEHITLDWQTKSQLAPVMADAGMLEQVVLNLVVNARDAMPKGGHITLSTEILSFTPEQVQTDPEARSGRFVCLSVADNGCGMSASTLKRIFEPFFTTKEAGQGTGLGLATVYGIVKQHQGWISVHSEVQHGSVFRIFLPAAEKAGAPGGAPAQPQAIEGGHETILLVEDEPGVRKTVGAFLRRWGYEVLEAADGPEAFRTWEAHQDRVALLFTDMVMPEGMTGLELAEKLRATKPGLKVILSSGYSAELFHHGAESIAGVRFLPKPCPPVELAAAIRGCLDGR